jgi:hypothetical protein
MPSTTSTITTSRTTRKGANNNNKTSSSSPSANPPAQAKRLKTAAAALAAGAAAAAAATTTTTAAAVAGATLTMMTSDLNFNDALKVRERYVREAVTQAEIMEKAAREPERLQREMQADIDRALVRLRPVAMEKSVASRGWSRSSRRAGLRAPRALRATRSRRNLAGMRAG